MARIVGYKAPSGDDKRIAFLPPLTRPISYLKKHRVGGDESWCLFDDDGKLIVATELHNKLGVYAYAHNAGWQILQVH